MIDRVKKLLAYQAAKQLVKDVYLVLKEFPKEEQYALCDQLRRAVISVPSNIAEGMGREGEKEQAHFLDIAYGSLLEVQCQLEIAKELEYINEQIYKQIEEQADKLGGMIVALRALRRPSASRPIGPSSHQSK